MPSGSARGVSWSSFHRTRISRVVGESFGIEKKQAFFTLLVEKQATISIINSRKPSVLYTAISSLYCEFIGPIKLAWGVLQPCN